MVRPVNGVSYDSFVCQQYFNLVLDGPAAPDDSAVAAINAIKAIPERLTYDDKPLVDAARAAYDKIATIQQQALVTNYSELVTAEQRIAALTPVNEEAEDNKLSAKAIITIIIIVVLLALVCIAVFFLIVYREKISKAIAAKKKKSGENKKKEKKDKKLSAKKKKKDAQNAPSESETENNGGEDESAD